MSTRALTMPIGWAVPATASESVPDTGPPLEEETEPTGPRGCTIYSAESLYEARLVLDLLEDEGIMARLFNEHLIGTMGELPFAETAPKIWLVDAMRYAAARAVIDAYEARRKQPVSGTQSCNACGEDSPGNFEVCWSCREPFDLE